MNWTVPEEIAKLLNQAVQAPLVPRAERERLPVLDREGVQGIVPYRDPFLLVDCVTWLDLERGMAATRYDLSRSAALFAGHFPRYPVWPGVLQTEGIGQTGGIVYVMQTGSFDRPSYALTHILAARFLRPVTPPGNVEYIAQVLDEGLLVHVVGQCLQNDSICSVAAVTFL